MKAKGDWNENDYKMLMQKHKNTIDLAYKLTVPYS